jgi:hypothetical protein
MAATDIFAQVKEAQEVDFESEAFVDYRPLLQNYFEILLDIDRFVPGFFDWMEDPLSWSHRETLAQTWGQLRLASMEESPTTLSAWIQTGATKTLSAVRSFVAKSGLHKDTLSDEEASACKSAIKELAALLRDLRAANDLRTYRQNLNSVVKEATESASTAKKSALVAQTAAGTSGGDSLSTHFDGLASGERWAANTFRVLALLAIGATPALAFYLPHPAANSIPELIYRILLIGGVGALAAYLGRQASQHRRTFNWARSLSVQLKSFPAFAEAAPDEMTKAAMFAEFSTRVLSAPPEKPQSTKEVNASQEQLQEILTLLIKRV